MRACESFWVFALYRRHPISLSCGTTFTRLLFRFTHRVSLHGGKEMIRLIWWRFWIPKLRNLVIATINFFRAIVVYRKRLQTQLMAVKRSTSSGPFAARIQALISISKTTQVEHASSLKAMYASSYASVLHLTANLDLMTEKFLTAFVQFVSRRGCRQQMYSDNGKTLGGASKVLSRELIKTAKTDHHHHKLPILWYTELRKIITIFWRTFLNRYNIWNIQHDWVKYLQKTYKEQVSKCSRQRVPYKLMGLVKKLHTSVKEGTMTKYRILWSIDSFEPY